MELTLKYFGQVAEVTSQSEETIALPAPLTGTALIEHLKALYKGLDQLKFKLAVNQEIITNETVISENAEVALLPPFSGG